LAVRDRIPAAYANREIVAAGGLMSHGTNIADLPSPEKLLATADEVIQAHLSEFSQGLSELGWTDGRNVHMDVRWTAGNVDRMRTLAIEMVSLQPDVILASTTPVIAALQRETRTIPIVFVLIADPIGDGFVASLSRPAGNITGLGYA
jgi:putative ABC transport system substrate-binding protein